MSEWFKLGAQPTAMWITKYQGERDGKFGKQANFSINVGGIDYNWSINTKLGECLQKQTGKELLIHKTGEGKDTRYSVKLDGVEIYAKQERQAQPITSTNDIVEIKKMLSQILNILVSKEAQVGPSITEDVPF